MRRCVFLDRDGIVNAPPADYYVHSWDEFSFMPGFIELLRAVLGRGYDVVVVTNQSGVARGVLEASVIDEIHASMQRVLREEHGLALLDVLYCPHDNGQCDCRKPQPGMLLAAASRHDIALGESWMVGDQERDVEAGNRAGCRTVLVSESVDESIADFTVNCLEGLRSLLMQELAG